MLVIYPFEKQIWDFRGRVEALRGVNLSVSQDWMDEYKDRSDPRLRDWLTETLGNLGPLPLTPMEIWEIMLEGAEWS